MIFVGAGSHPNNSPRCPLCYQILIEPEKPPTKKEIIIGLALGLSVWAVVIYYIIKYFARE